MTSSLIADSSSVSRFAASRARPRSVRKYSGGRTPPPMITKCAGRALVRRGSRPPRRARASPSAGARSRRSRPRPGPRAGRALRLPFVAVRRGGRRADAVVHDRERKADREALGHVAVDRDRGVAPALHQRGDHAAAPVAALAGECRAQVPDDLRAVPVRDPGGGEERRVVQVHDGEAVRAHEPLAAGAGAAAARRPRARRRASADPRTGCPRRARRSRRRRCARSRPPRRRARPRGPRDRRRAARSGGRGAGSAAPGSRARRRAAGGGGRTGSGCGRGPARCGGRCASIRRAFRAGSKFCSACSRAARPSARRRSGWRSSSSTASASVSTPKSSTSTPVSPGTTTPPPVREPEATTGTPLAAASITGRPSSGPCDGRDDDVARLVQVGRVLRERDEADDLGRARGRRRAASPRTRSRASGRRAEGCARRRCGRTPRRAPRRRRSGSSRRARDRAARRRPR